ncbi:hypothetical protein [Rhizobium sp. 18065]|uniref:phage tail protein n=1 Tax=Rhizobium sp. 18065 TaxID=2681411 RepID=UPI00135AC3B7|nr:hypothetical protein [Rhizobium sp. 18065]
MPAKLSNNASSTLAGAINTSVTSLAVGAGDASKFPTLGAGEWFPLTVVDPAGNMEIMKVTARSGATLTVVRAQEGTTAKSFAAGSRVDLRATSAVYNSKSDATDVLTALALKADSAGLALLAAEVAARLPVYTAGAAFPASNVGPIYHVDYASIMTWQTFSANGAAYAGYASIDIGRPSLDGQSTARPGMLKRNGASLSKTTYAALWNWALHNGRTVALGSWAAGAFVFADNGDGTFKLPDSRGEFERVWDDGRGIDTSRVLGSLQLDQMQQITGSLSTTSGAIRNLTGSGAFTAGAVNGTTNASSGTNDSLGSFSFNSANSPGARTGSETRSRNVALLGDIKF